MSCNDCKCFHKVSGMTYTAGTSLTVASSNSTNISSLDSFCFVIPCSINPTSIVTGSPVQVYMTVNGANYPLLNKYSLPVYSNYLFRRKLYKGYFVTDPTDTTNSWVILSDLPQCKCHA